MGCIASLFSHPTSRASVSPFGSLGIMPCVLPSPGGRGRMEDEGVPRALEGAKGLWPHEGVVVMWGG